MYFREKSLLTIFIFILVVSVICMCDNLVSMAAIISIICSFVVINSNMFIISGYNTIPSTVPITHTTESMIDDYKNQLEHDDPLSPIYTQGIFKGDLYDNTIEPFSDSKSEKDNKDKNKSDNKSDKNINQKDISEMNIPLKEMQKQNENPNQKHLEQRLYEMHESYNTPFESQMPIIGLGEPEADCTIDSANMRMARARTRDKRTLTGTTLKDANFFKKFYGDEFDESENRWWYGRDDY